MSPPSEFGHLSPLGFQKFIINVTRRLPPGWLGMRVGYLLRRIGLLTMRSAVDLSVFGARMRLNPRDNLCEKRVLFMPQFFDCVEREVLAEHMHEQFTFVDIGANVGIYSLFVAKHAGPNARVISVEPDPEIHARLQFNLDSNRFSNVCAVRKAVSGECGELSLFIDKSNRGLNSLIDNGGESTTVECLTLLKLFDDFEIDAPDAIKIDIEGAELTVLESFFRMADVNRYPRLLILESSRRDQLSDAAQLTLDHGYRVRARARLNVVLELSDAEVQSVNEPEQGLAIIPFRDSAQVTEHVEHTRSLIKKVYRRTG